MTFSGDTLLRLGVAAGDLIVMAGESLPRAKAGGRPSTAFLYTTRNVAVGGRMFA
jgi:hypothetical protein